MTEEHHDKQSLSVSEVCRVVEQTFDTLFTDEIWIRGAISGLNRSRNGHVYFDLVEPDSPPGEAPEAVLPVALFANAKFRVNAILKKTGSVRMADGIEIRIRGKLTYYPRQSRVQLIMSLIDPSYTLGQLEMARAQLIAQLRSEGMLEANRQRELSVVPLRVGLVTSKGSAAEADFLHELDASGLPFVVYPFDARVQGDTAVESISTGITAAAEAPVDVVVVVRGGGARTDLAAFDHELVARAIASCPLPVIVGVGHEIDRSVADDVAHTSAKTPTAAAGVLIDACLDFRERIASARQRIGRLAQASVDKQGFRLELLEDRLGRTAAQHLERSERLLEQVEGRIGRASLTHLERSSAQLSLLEEQVRRTSESGLERAQATLSEARIRARALDPALTLARGWSITRTADGSVVRVAGELADGDVLHTTLGNGTVRSTVQPT